MDLRDEVDKIFNDRVSKLIQRQKNKGSNSSRHDTIEILQSMRNQVRAIFETFEILCNPEIVDGLKSALEDFKEGRYEVLTSDDALHESKDDNNVKEVSN